tara:strand:+ start:668 stop:844 length:177 start_codon:yes stop_codon:yes gene_type:complete
MKYAYKKNTVRIYKGFIEYSTYNNFKVEKYELNIILDLNILDLVDKETADKFKKINNI